MCETSNKSNKKPCPYDSDRLNQLAKEDGETKTEKFFTISFADTMKPFLTPDKLADLLSGVITANDALQAANMELLDFAPANRKHILDPALVHEFCETLYPYSVLFCAISQIYENHDIPKEMSAAQAASITRMHNKGILNDEQYESFYGIKELAEQLEPLRNLEEVEEPDFSFLVCVAGEP